MAEIEVRHLSTERARAEVDAWLEGEVEHISDQAAQTVASWHQSPGYLGAHMAQLSTTGRCDELLPTEVRRNMERYPYGAADREALEALLDYTDLFVPVIKGCWSSFGHIFQETDTPLEERCLGCGGTWAQERRTDDPSMADYKAADGRDPVECSGETDLHHGTEAVCQADYGRPCRSFDDRGRCRHMAYLRMPTLESQEMRARPACNCITCQP